jgi:hypothetical protein
MRAERGPRSIWIKEDPACLTKILNRKSSGSGRIVQSGSHVVGNCEAEAARQEAQPEFHSPQSAMSGGLLMALAAGSALAAYNPKLAIGAGGFTLAAASFLKKDWKWWAVGILLLILGSFFHWNEKVKTEGTGLQ